MSDLTDIQSAESVKIIGSSSTGVEGTPVNSTSNGGLHTNLRDDSGTEVGTSTNPIYTSNNALITGAAFRSSRILAAGTTQSDSYTMTQDVALTDFHFGGRGIGQASIFRLDSSAVEFVPSGGFNSSGDVSAWTNAGEGSSSGLTWAYTTSQFFEGTGSATVTFTQSGNGNTPQIKYTWSTPKDVSVWKQISAHVRVTVAAGGSTSRSAQIILSDINGNTRTYSLTGTTTTSPFSTEQWLQVLGTIDSPTSETGTFDPYNVSSINLKLIDGANKAGTIYWDNVRFLQSQTLIERIYIDANRTFQLNLYPVETFSIGSVLGISFKNNDSSSKEYTVTAKGIVL